MTTVSYEEMEAKRQEMVASFKEIAQAMTRCVAIIEDYARLAPSTLSTTAALAAIHESAAATDALAAAAGGKKRNKKEKKVKDPNAPKRPPSAYLLFQNDIREQIRTAHPGLPYKEVLSVIANRWKDLDDNARKVYEDAYNAATVQFRQQDEAYKLTGNIPPQLLTGIPAVSSDSEEDDSSSEAATPTKLPPTLAATPLTSGKKDKKRKNKDEEVVATPVVESAKKEKKKAKKTKD